MLGFLLSYWYFKDRDLAALIEPLDPRPPIFADSGAYSAMTQGGTVDLDAYAAWIDRWGHLFEAYASLDVIKDPKGTLRNHARLLEKGLAPVPVFHAGEPWGYLDDYVASHPYVALGGLVGGPTAVRNPQMIGWLDQAFARVNGAQVHGFGMTSWPLVARYPWHSVDSSSIGSGYRYGTVRCWDPYGRRWLGWKLADRRAWGKHGWLVREYGMTPGDFGGDRQHRTRSLMTLGARSMARAVGQLPARPQMYLVDTAFTWRAGAAGETMIELFNTGGNAAPPPATRGTPGAAEQV